MEDDQGIEQARNSVQSKISSLIIWTSVHHKRVGVAALASGLMHHPMFKDQRPEDVIRAAARFWTEVESYVPDP